MIKLADGMFLNAEIGDWLPMNLISFPDIGAVETRVLYGRTWWRVPLDIEERMQAQREKTR